jgi:hypothetical protein
LGETQRSRQTNQDDDPVFSHEQSSEDLHINILTRHNDPRTGQLTVKVTEINIGEPGADLFAIPRDYRLVDMTPPESESLDPSNP